MHASTHLAFGLRDERDMQSSARAHLSGLRVLVVEDDVDVRQVMCWILEANGATVCEARTGREALDLVRHRTFDVVLTDLGLPDMSGEAVIVAIRASAEAHTPVAVVSGQDPTTLWRALELGAERSFHKPVDWEDLMRYLSSKQPTVVAESRRGRAAEEKMTVLVIEDDIDMRALLCDALEIAGYRAVSRADGRDLIALVEVERFEAVIVDKELPGPNGLDLLSFFRRRLPEVPVIVVTAFGGPAVAEEAAIRGAYSYLEKPFRITAILSTLAAVARGETVGGAGALD
jgi:DNA-binding NtrC family response regulator